MDLLSGDDFSSPKVDNSLALVPVGGQQPSSSVSDQNAIVLFDMFSDSNNVPNSVNTQSANMPGQNNPLTTQAQQQQNFQSPQGGFYPNGSLPNMGAPQYGNAPAWNGQITQPQQQQPVSPVYGALFYSFFSCVLVKHNAVSTELCSYFFN